MTKKYIIEGEEFAIVNVDYVKSAVIPGCVEAVRAMEPIEGSCYTVAEFDNLADAEAELARCSAPAVDENGIAEVFSLLAVDEDGEEEVLATTADGVNLVEMYENA